jgi:hypothetical protein
MAVVRYVALAALVVWLGGMLNALAGDVYHHVFIVSCACGVVILACLLVMKFVGPPPRGFLVRLALVVLMLVVTLLAGMGVQPLLTLAASLAIGLILLSWYARE